MIATKVMEERGRAGTGDALVHLYPDSAAPLGVGSVAFCGHVKTTPWSGLPRVTRRGLRREHCVVCADLVWRSS